MEKIINYKPIRLAKDKPLKAYLNIFNLRLNMAFKRQLISNYPIEAYIEPTMFCHLHCPGCPTGLRLGLRPHVSIELGMFKSIIDRIGSYLFRLQIYNWGEPLLYKQLPEMIQYAKAKGIEVILGTNLSVKLSDDDIEKLVTSGVDRLIVSLDGTTEETYNKYRRGGDFNLVRDNMRRIQAAKQRLRLPTPLIVWQFLVFLHNEHEINTAVSVYKEWGADTIMVEGALMPYETFQREFEPSSLPQYNIYHPDHPNKLKIERQIKSRRTCAWLYGVFVLNPNGSVSPCCSVPPERLDFATYSPGDNFMTVWNSPKFRRARGMVGASSSRKQTKGVTAEEYVNIVGRSNAMASGLSMSMSEDEIICQKCPIPWRQNENRYLINDIGYSLMASFFKSPVKNARNLLAYLMMGATSLQDIGWFISNKWRYLILMLNGGREQPG
ncbi:MAG: radical SAM protein [Dehalococcoidia bacterium]